MKKTTIDLHSEILAETYEDMQGLITKTVWDFWKVYGGDVEDLMAQANLIFIEAVDTYNPSKSKLTTWLMFIIRKRLLTYIKDECKQAHVQINKYIIDTYPAHHKDFSVMEMLDEMKQDALVVLQLFLETPQEIMVDMLNDGKRIDQAPACMRRRLKNRLRQMGWRTKRIKKAFKEIKQITSY